MPFFGNEASPPTDFWPRQRAWQAHYMAKGCGRDKAYWLARDKARRRSTWPPCA